MTEMTAEELDSSESRAAPEFDLLGRAMEMGSASIVLVDRDGQIKRRSERGGE
jgi:hypothetical protein